MSGIAGPPWEEELIAQALAELKEQASRDKWTPRGLGQKQSNGDGTHVRLHIHMEPGAPAALTGDSGQEPGSAAAAGQSPVVTGIGLSATARVDPAVSATAHSERRLAADGYTGYQPYRMDSPPSPQPVVGSVRGLFGIPQRAVTRLLSPEHGDPSPLLFFPWATIFAMALFGLLIVALAFVFNNFGDEMSKVLEDLQRSPVKQEEALAPVSDQ